MKKVGRRTDIIRVELVDTNQDTNSGCPQNPSKGFTEDRELAGMKVIDEQRVELWKLQKPRIKSHQKSRPFPTNAKDTGRKGKTVQKGGLTPM